MDGFKVSLCWTSICISDASFINFGLGSQGVSRRLPRLALSSAGKIRHLNFSFFPPSRYLSFFLLPTRPLSQRNVLQRHFQRERTKVLSTNTENGPSLRLACMSCPCIIFYYYSNPIPGIQRPSRSARCFIAHPRQKFYPNDANAYHPIKGEHNGVGAFRHAPSHCSHAWTSIVKAHRAAALP